MKSKIFKGFFALFIVQFFTWIALFSLWIYATPVFVKYIFHTTDTDSNQYSTGLMWVSICFAFYAIVGAIFNFIAPYFFSKISKWFFHSISLALGSVGLFLVGSFGNKFLLFISFFFIGIAWSSIGNVMYKIVEELIPDEKKLNYYFNVFNFSVVIPQIVSALLLEYLTRTVFHSEVINTLRFGSACMLMAAILMFVSTIYLRMNKPTTIKEVEDKM